METTTSCQQWPSCCEMLVEEHAEVGVHVLGFGLCGSGRSWADPILGKKVIAAIAGSRWVKVWIQAEVPPTLNPKP